MRAPPAGILDCALEMAEGPRENGPEMGASSAGLDLAFVSFFGLPAFELFFLCIFSAASLEEEEEDKGEAAISASAFCLPCGMTGENLVYKHDEKPFLGYLLDTPKRHRFTIRRRCRRH